jgi:cytosine/adenosine deaminase-related metal-dependent hydrolase
MQGNFTTEDGYAAARLSIAEMLKTGTTCFLESMVGLPLQHIELVTDHRLPSSQTDMGSMVFVRP